jgi:hypothetical protein
MLVLKEQLISISNMLSIKNTKGLSKNELLKINELFDACLGSSNLIIDESSNLTDLISYDIHNVLSNDYIIYEMVNGLKILGFLGLVTSGKIAIISELQILDKQDIKLAKKLIGMIQMISRNPVLVVISKNNTEMIEFYKNINFDFCNLEYIDYDEETEVVMMKI